MKGGMSKKSIPPQNWREGRRMRAWELHEQGWKQKDIAAALGVSEGAVSQWFKKAKAKASRSLAASTSSRQARATESRTEGAVAGLAGAGSGSLRVSRAGLDHRARGGDDAAAVRRQLSSCPWQSPPSSHQAKSAKAHPKGDPKG